MQGTKVSKSRDTSFHDITQKQDSDHLNPFARSAIFFGSHEKEEITYLYRGLLNYCIEVALECICGHMPVTTPDTISMWCTLKCFAVNCSILHCNLKIRYKSCFNAIFWFCDRVSTTPTQFASQIWQICIAVVQSRVVNCIPVAWCNICNICNICLMQYLWSHACNATWHLSTFHNAKLKCGVMICSNLQCIVLGS